MSDLLSRPSDDILDRAADAALVLAEDRPWGDITLRDIAKAAGVSFAELYSRAPGKAALIGRHSRRFDREALALSDAEDAPDPHDRLFEAVMARLEAMALHKPALVAIARAAPAVLASRLPWTAKALLEAAGIDTGGRRGSLRVMAMTAVWARILQVWRDDEGALNRTMAEIDKRLRQMRDGLTRVRAGY